MASFLCVIKLKFSTNSVDSCTWFILFISSIFDASVAGKIFKPQYYGTYKLELCENSKF